MGLWDKKRRTPDLEEDALLAQVPLSTLSTSPRQYQEVGLVWGDPAPDEAEALRNLQRRARESGSDAVLGMSLYSGGSERLFSTRRRNDQWRAYGTGVRWLRPETPQPSPAVPPPPAGPTAPR